MAAESFHVIEYIDDELAERGWDYDELAIRMGGDINVNRAALDFLGLRDPRILLGSGSANKLAVAFRGTNARTWLNLDEIWRKHQEPSHAE